MSPSTRPGILVPGILRRCGPTQRNTARTRRPGEQWDFLHDFDYEVYPEFPDHPTKGSEILKERGLPEDLRRAILSHVPAMNIPRESVLEKTLFACDELCGFLVACALVRPNRLKALEASSVKKKLKDKAFARAVDREHIYKGAEEAGLNLEEHISFTVASLRGVAADLGLA